MINKEKIETALFFLEYLASEDEEFIDSNDHEFLGEDENGCSGVCTLKITDIAGDAVELIKHIKAQRDELLAALKLAEKLITKACVNAVDKLNEIAPDQGWDSGEVVAEMYIRELRESVAKCEAQS